MTTIDPAHFIRTQRYGVLSTHSQTEQGYPFGSITPYIVSDNGDIAIFISALAEHTHNIKAVPKVSLTIFDPADANNPNAGARITCLANAKIIEDDVQLRHDYLQHFPNAAQIMALPDFNFYILKLVKIRLIAGFGQIKWLTPNQLSL